MATPPRSNKSRTTASSRAKKPTTIDLEAVEIKKDETEEKTVEDTAKQESSADQSVKAEAASSEPKDKPATTRGKTVPRTTTKSRSTSRSTANKTSSAPAKEDEKKSAQEPAKKAEAKKEPAKDNKPDPAPKTKSAAPAKPAKSGSGFGRMAAAGIVGGVVSLGGAAYLQNAGYIPGQAPKVETPVVDLAPLETKFAALESQVRQNASQTTQVIDLGPLESRIAAMEGKVAQVLENPPVAGSVDENAAQQLNAELNNLKAEIEQLKSAGSDLSQQIAALPEVQEVKSLSQEDVTKIVSPLIDPLAQSSEANKSNLAEIKASLEALNNRFEQDIVTRVDSFEQKLENAATGERLAKSVAINSLKSAVENGEPYSAALASVETIAGSSAPIDELKKYASSGIPTAKMLLNEFRSMQSNILLTASSNEESSLTDRMMLSVKSLVTISSDEPLPGDSPEAVISRIEASLKSGQLSQARTEWELLPDRAKNISQKWADKLLLRSSADKQIGLLLETIQSSKTSG